MLMSTIHINVLFLVKIEYWLFNLHSPILESLMRALLLLFNTYTDQAVKVYISVCISKCIDKYKVETDYREILSLDVLCDGGEGDPLLCQPVSQRSISKGISRSVNTSSIGHPLHLLQYDHA